MIKAGEGVICSTQSANRDAAVFTDPDKFDIHRQPNAHLGFGYGVHECIAADLSRAELQIALGE
jgi:cytochrome P450